MTIHDNSSDADGDPTDLDDLGDDDETERPAPYVFDALHASVAARVLDQAAANHKEMHDLQNAVEAAANAAGLGPRDSLVLTLSAMAWYRLKVDRTGGGPGAALEPLQDDGKGWYWPQPIRCASNDVKRLWAEVSSITSHPVAAARAHDLCFSGRVGNGGAHALAAGRAYLQWPTTELDSLYVTLGLVRAWTLARAIGDAALEQDVYAELASYSRAQLDAGGNPGTVLPLLEALATPPRTSTSTVGPTVIEGLIADARSVFTESYIQVRLTAMMRRVAIDDAGRDAANRAEVQAHLDEAGRARQGAVRMHHLEAAARTARRFNVKDLEAVAVSAMQAITPDELGLQVIKAGGSIPAHVPESFLRQFDEADDWREAIHRFLHTEAPTGSYDQNLASAKKSLERPSLRHLFSSVRIGAHGLPQQTTSADADRLEAELVWFEETGASIFGQWHADGLDRILATFGIPSKDEIVVFMVDTYSCDIRMARAFATCIRLFWDGEYDACVHLAVPRVEAAARALLLDLDEPLYRVEQGNTIGQFPGLGFLLPQLLKCDFDPDWERFLGTLLLPRGENLRNLIAHGFVSDIGSARAALILRAAGLMSLLSPADGADEDADVLRQYLHDPLHFADRYCERHPLRARLVQVRRRVSRFLGPARSRRRR